MKNYTEIKGMFEQRRLVRLGIIRLGLKKKNENGVEYPIETDYFVCPPEIQKEFGAKPKEIEIMIASADRSLTMPYSYTLYGSGTGVKCKGNGETANEKQKDGTWKEKKCPCDKLKAKKNGCKMVGHFQFIIPSINMAACYQINTTSYRSVQEILNGLQAIEDFFKRPCDEIALYPDEKTSGKWRSPILMRRIEGQTHHDDKKQIHYPIQIYPRVDPKYVNYLMECQKRTLESKRVVLPLPEEKNPTLDPVDVIVEEGIIDEEDTKKVTSAQDKNKPQDKPEAAPAKTTKEEKADTPPPKEKATESEKSANPDMSTLEQQQSIHILATKAKIDVYKKYGVKSAKEFSFDRAEEIKKELSELLNKQIKDKGKSEKKKEFLPETIEDCRAAVISLAEQLGIDESQAEKEIKERCGLKPTLPQLQAVYKQYAKQLSGE